MDKPATLLQREFRDKIVTAINDSHLPAFVLLPVMETAVQELRDVEQRQYEEDLKAYEEGNNGETSET